MALAQLIERFDLFSFECSISTADHGELFSGLVPYGLSKPYCYCAYGAASALSRYIHTLGGREPVTFVFDEQSGADQDLMALWDWLRRSSPRQWRSILGPTPRFADDENEVALQAADMLAWHRRRSHENRELSENFPASGLLTSDPHLALAIDRPVLEHMALNMRRLPGISGIISKFGWRQTRNAIKERQIKGLGPPRFGPRTVFVALWIKSNIAKIFGRNRKRQANRRRKF